MVGGRLRRATILSTDRRALPCPAPVPHVRHVIEGKMIMASSVPDAGVIEFKTQPGLAYVLTPR